MMEVYLNCWHEKSGSLSRRFFVLSGVFIGPFWFALIKWGHQKPPAVNDVVVHHFIPVWPPKHQEKTTHSCLKISLIFVFGFLFWFLFIAYMLYKPQLWVPKVSKASPFGWCLVHSMLLTQFYSSWWYNPVSWYFQLCFSCIIYSCSSHDHVSTLWEPQTNGGF